MPCGRRQLGNGANDNVSLKNDWGAGTQTYLSPIASKTWPQQTGGYKMKFHINNYIWWIEAASLSGQGGVYLSQPTAVTGIPSANNANSVGSAWYFLSDTYSSVTLNCNLFGRTWVGWYNASSGGTLLNSNNPWTISYTDSVITGGTTTIWARTTP